VHFIGIDLNKKSISLCVMSKGRKVLCEKVGRTLHFARRRVLCYQEGGKIGP